MAIFQAASQGFASAQNQAVNNAQASGKAPPQPVIGVPTQLASNLYGFVGQMLAGSIAKANNPGAQQQQQQQQPAAPQQVPLPPTPAAQ